MSETKISKAIADMIKKEFGDWLEVDRHQVGTLQKFKRWIHCGSSGWADRLGVIKKGALAGKFIAIEVKKPDEGKQSEDQVKFQSMVEQATAIYLLVDSVEDCREQLKEVLT